MERQHGTTLEEIRYDHRARYCFARDLIPLGSRVLDAACGIGYGSKIFYQAGFDVVGVDIDAGALFLAQHHYPGPQYLRLDIQDAPFFQSVDAVVSFETLEHLNDPVRALKWFAKWLPAGGRFIASVPNEERYPFEAETFAQDVYPHLRHYTPLQFEQLLNAGGFEVISKHCQIGKRSDVTDGTDGMFLVYVSRRC